MKNIKFFFKQLANKLWFRPIIFCLVSVIAALLAQLADNSFLVDIAPAIEQESVEELLNTISATMLVIAIFAVGAMLSAFASASSTATPRSFKLIVSDDVSQNALSVFIGSFIYSIVATIALQNGLYGKAGYFTLFVLTLAVFALVIITFLRWVERISKLGRLGHTIKKVEDAAMKAFKARKKAPTMGGLPGVFRTEKGHAVYSDKYGYVQHINLGMLQKWAEENDMQLSIHCLPGAFAAADKPLFYITNGFSSHKEQALKSARKLFVIGNERSFDDDPRFGVIALSEIASRALSPGINDPGTAIAIMSSHVRLFTVLAQQGDSGKDTEVVYNRVEVPEVDLIDLFDDAFRPIARDGANNIEVMIRLQKALQTIAHLGDAAASRLAVTHSFAAFERSKIAMEYDGDIALLEKECLFTRNQSV